MNVFSLTPRELSLLAKLGAELRRQRISAKARQADFAQNLGISVPTYRKMERGVGNIPVSYWIRALVLLDQVGGLETLLNSSRPVSLPNLTGEHAPIAPPTS